MHYVKGTEAELSRYGNHTLILFSFFSSVLYTIIKYYVSQLETVADLSLIFLLTNPWPVFDMVPCLFPSFALKS